jgi:tryptophan halogenase
MDCWPERADPRLSDLPLDTSLDWVQTRARQLAEAVAPLATHDGYLKRILGR